MIIKCKINTDKIDKTKMFKGEKGTYLDITLLSNKDGVDQYGNDGMIVQDVSKADREAGIKGAILGNYRIMEQRSGGTLLKHTSSNEKPESDDAPVPF